MSIEYEHQVRLSLRCFLRRSISSLSAQIWGCVNDRSNNNIQRSQNRVLRGIVKAFWYIRKADIHRDLKVNK